MFARIRLLLVAQLCVFMSGCIGESSDDCISYADVTVINVVLDLPIDSYQSANNRVSNVEEQGLDVRIIIGVYTKGGDLVEKKIVSAGSAGSAVYPIDATFHLPEDEYRFVFWSDYTQHSSTADLYYDTEDLTGIVARNNQEGGTEAKDAYTAYKDVDLSLGGQMNETIVLHRPFARYRIVSTDLAKFIEMGGVSDVDKIQVKVNYPGFVYDVYDAFRGMPVDIGNISGFTGSAKVLSADEMLLVWDYVWAGEEESVVEVDLMIYDNKGNIINRVGNIHIPCMRNKSTTVRGAFLTEESESGIGIITEYEGTIHVPLP